MRRDPKGRITSMIPISTEEVTESQGLALNRNTGNSTVLSGKTTDNTGVAGRWVDTGASLCKFSELQLSPRSRKANAISVLGLVTIL